MMSNTQYVLAWVPGHWEMLVVLVIALLLFGKRLPDVARSVGRSLTEFKKGINEAKEDVDNVAGDVRKMGNEAVGDAKKAAGLDDNDKA